MKKYYLLIEQVPLLAFLLTSFILPLKDQIDAAVKVLLDLKAEYKALTGEDVPSAGRGSSKKDKKKEAAKKDAKPKQEAAKQKKDKNVDAEAGAAKKTTRYHFLKSCFDALSVKNHRLWIRKAIALVVPFVQ